MSKHKTRNTFYRINWKVNSLLMKFGHFVLDWKRKIFIHKFYKNCDLKTSSRSFCVCKGSSTIWTFWSNLLILDKYQQTIQICQNHHAYLLRFFFTEDSLKIEKGLGTSFQDIFFTEFFGNNFSFVILDKLAKVHYPTVFTSQVIQ